MARIRTIKPEFPQSESMGRVSRESRLCFILLFTLADDGGRLRGNSRMLASLLYPYDDDARKHIESWLAELEREQCICRYSVEDDQYIEIIQWRKHQKIDKPTASKIPPPPTIIESSRILANPREMSSEDSIKEGIKEGSGLDAPAKRSPSLDKPSDIAQQTWDDWCKLRKAKKAPVTQTVINGARKESEKAGISLELFLQIWCRRGSQGLEASWLKPEEQIKPNGGMLPGAI